MTSVVILLIILVFVFVALWQVDKDFLSPSILMVISFIGGLLLLIHGHERLEYKTISFDTSFLLFSGIMAFVIGCLICKSFRNHKKVYDAFMNPKPIDISIVYYIIFTLFSMLTAYIQFRHEMSYVGFAGAFTEIVKEYRDEAAGVDSMVPPNPFVNISSRIIYAIQPLLIFITFYNKILCKRKTEKPIILFACVLLYIGSIFVMAGSRGKVFTFLFQILFSISICCNFANKFKKKRATNSLPGNMVWIKSGMALILIGIPLFYYSGVAQGKGYDDYSVLDPVENYFSIGIIHLDHTVVTSRYESENFGQWSFSGLYSLLNKTGGKYQNYDILPFYGRYGNTLTIFGRWYQDFNLLGVLIMAFISGYVFSLVYYNMLYAKNSKIALKYSVLYVFLMGIIIMACYDDWIRGALTLNGVFQIVVLIYIIKYICKKYFKPSYIVK